MAKKAKKAKKTTKRSTPKKKEEEPFVPKRTEYSDAEKQIGRDNIAGRRRTIENLLKSAKGEEQKTHLNKLLKDLEEEEKLYK